MQAALTPPARHRAQHKLQSPSDTNSPSACVRKRAYSFGFSSTTPSGTQHTVSTADPHVQSVDGDHVRLASLWKHRKIVLVFLRHFGCRFCWRLASMMKQLRKDLKEDDEEFEVVLISMGTISQAETFKQDLGWDGELYVDFTGEPIDFRAMQEELARNPTKDAAEVYTLFRLNRGLEYLRTPEAIAKGAEAENAGFVDHPNYAEDEREWAADVSQLGGVFVMGPGNACDYSYRSLFGGDDPDLAVVYSAMTGTSHEGRTYEYPSTTAWLERLEVRKSRASSVSTPHTATKPNTGESKRAPLPAAHPPVSDTADVSKCPFASMMSSATTSPKAPPSVLLPYSSALMSLSAAFSMVLFTAFGLLHVDVFRREMATRLRYPANDPRAVLSMAVLFATVAVWLRNRLVRKDTVDMSVLDSISFLKASDVDELILARGLIECDCNEVLSRIDMEESAENVTADVVVPSVAIDDKDLACLQTMLCYFREFLAKPNTLLGRTGPTCPFVPKGLRIDSMYYGIVHTAGVADPRNHIARVVNAARVRFHDLLPLSVPHGVKTSKKASRAAIYKAIILVFPDVSLDEAPELIDRTQRALKAEFVSEGLMLGEFHMLNNTQGLHNNQFYPLRTPVPVLAIRHMVPSDLVFLNMNQYDAKTRVQFLSSYLASLQPAEKKAGPKPTLSDKERAKAEAALAEARKLLAGS